MIDWFSHIDKLKKKDSLEIDDKFWRMQNLYPIIDKNGIMRPLQFNEHQDYLAHCISYNIARKDFAPIIILKARQVGISTFCCIWFLDDVLFYEGRNAVIQSYQHISKDSIFRIISNAFKYIYDPFKVLAVAEMSGEAKSDSVYVPSANSRLTSHINVRSQAVNMLLYSEYALMEWANIIATLGSATPDCLKLYESTAKGRNHLYKLWGEQKEKDITKTHCLFIGWHKHKEYVSVVKPEGLGELDDNEQELKEKYGVSDEQLQWRRNKREEMSLNDEHNSFEQEYPANDRECFDESGNNLIDGSLLDYYFEQTKKRKPVSRYWLTNNRGENKTLVKVFKEYSQKDIENMDPDKFFSFYAGVDPAEGVGKDFSVCVVISVDHLQRIDVVMTLRGHTDPTTFAEHIDNELRKYGFEGEDEDDYGEKLIELPTLTVERNNHGHAVLALLIPTYNNIYIGTDRKEGFLQTNPSRKMIMHNILNVLRHRQIKLNDPVIAKELSALRVNEKNKKIEAFEGEHDDCVIALALAFHGYYAYYENFEHPEPEKKVEEEGRRGDDSGLTY